MISKSDYAEITPNKTMVQCKTTGAIGLVKKVYSNGNLWIRWQETRGLEVMAPNQVTIYTY